MLGKLDHISSFLSFRNASIRTKVIVAFAGVLALILPQIGLTVTYLVDLFEDGEGVERSTRASLSLGRINTQLEKCFLEPYPQSLEELEDHRALVEEGMVQIQEATDDFKRLRTHDERFDAYVATLEKNQKKLVDYLGAIGQQVAVHAALSPPVVRREVTSRLHRELDDLTRGWTEPPLEGPPEEGIEPPPSANDRLKLLEEYIFRGIKDVVAAQNRDDEETRYQIAQQSDDAARSWRLRRAILEEIGELRTQVNSENARAAEQIKESVDEANRYLITLVLLTLVYIFVVVFTLPSKLVRPLDHFSSVIDRAGTGQLDVRARVVGDDEMGHIGRSLNTMLERLGSFDRLKRDRIYEDAARIRNLGDRLESPVAIFDTHLVFEYANTAMREVMQLPEDVEGRELLSVLNGRDANALVAVLDKSLKRRRSMEDLVIELEAGTSVQSFQVRTEIGRNRSGQISYLVVTLKTDG